MQKSALGRSRETVPETTRRGSVGSVSAGALPVRSPRMMKPSAISLRTAKAPADTDRVTFTLYPEHNCAWLRQKTRRCGQKTGFREKKTAWGRMRGRTGRFQRLSAITPVKLLHTGQSVCAAAFKIGRAHV